LDFPSITLIRLQTLLLKSFNFSGHHSYSVLESIYMPKISLGICRGGRRIFSSKTSSILSQWCQFESNVIIECIWKRYNHVFLIFKRVKWVVRKLMIYIYAENLSRHTLFFFYKNNFIRTKALFWSRNLRTIKNKWSLEIDRVHTRMIIFIVWSRNMGQ